MDYNENMSARMSHLRPPSKIPPTPARGLLEMTASENNARASSMMPPPSQGIKHKASGCMKPPVLPSEASRLTASDETVPQPEPAPKRKTLAERAGEAPRSYPAAPPSSRPVNGAVKATVTAGVRNTSNGSSVSSRVPSTSSRNASAGSSANGVSYNSRTPSSAGSYHAQTAMGQTRVTSSAPAPTPRPSTAMENNALVGEQPGSLGKRKGTLPISISAFQPTDRLQLRKQRARHDLHGNYIPNILSGKSGNVTASGLSQSQSQDSSYSTKEQYPFRDVSLSAAFSGLSLKPDALQQAIHPDDSMFDLRPTSEREKEPECPKTPSYIPKLAPKTPVLRKAVSHQHFTPATRYKVRADSPCKFEYLTRDSNTPTPAWDTKGRLEDMELLYSQLKTHLDSATTEKSSLEETMNLYKSRLTELEQTRLQLSTTNQTLSSDLDDTKARLSTTTTALEDARRSHTFEVDDLRRKHRNETEDTKDQHRKEIDRLRREAREETDRLRKEAQDEAVRLARSRKEDLADLEKELKAEIEEERSRRIREVQEVTTQWAVQRQTTDLDLSQRDRETQHVKEQLSETQASLDRANALASNLKEKLTEASTNALALETSMRAMKAKIDFLESDNQAQSQAFADLNQKMQDAVDSAAEAHAKLRAEETLRRKLHNQVQELKGNIRVFCRVRPTLPDEVDESARIAFPDCETDSREVALQGPEQKSAMGNITTQTNAFAFDRVFGPTSQNAAVFEEIQQLVQSALDGYNVCIFCYGQTGSGKTFTMSEPGDGMIPRAVHQIYEHAKSLEEKGWSYSMEGSFVEVYNEALNDLLGKAEDWEKKKHEIRHDPVKKTTCITDITTVTLDSPERVNAILESASRNRSVAATKANSRSSRSHS
ncbi:kinesin-like nuclear fusion protein, partial [Elasticomyces elasticus]